MNRSNFMEIFLQRLSSLVWGNALVLILLVTGAAYTLRLRGVQLRLIPYFMRNKPVSGQSGLSQRRTVCMALGAAMGTGNITGVAAALAAGGAGALFWMWVSAFLGMALSYAENALSAAYCDEDVRGPMAYISKGLGSPVLAAVFAGACVLVSLGMGGMVQVSSFSAALSSCAVISPAAALPAVFAVIFLITSGGAKRIGAAAEVLLPAAALLYGGACIIVIIRHSSALPEALRSIFSSAFGARQVTGGIGGFTVSQAVSAGIRRGVFSNEAGLGSLPLLHSASGDTDPLRQSMWSMFEVFFDTMICCTLTALAILSAAPDMSVETALGSLLGGGAGAFLAAELGVFALCTVIGWYYCGETAFLYLFRRHKMLFCCIFSAVSALGTVVSPEAVWALSDIFNGLMAFVNIFALIMLFRRVGRYK